MMNRIFFWPFFVLLSTGFYAQQINQQILKTPISDVKLFLTSGEMTHKAEVKLTKGRNKLIFNGISAFADPRSIQLSTLSNARLVSVSTEMDFLSGENVDTKIKILSDSLDLFNFKYQDVSDEIDAYQGELAVLNTNRNIKGTSTLTVAQIKETAEYFHKRTLEINKAISKLKREQNILTINSEQTRNQLLELNYHANQQSNQIVILIDTDSPNTQNLVIKYLVSDCGWVATYDLSAEDLEKTINLKYKAQVYNNTGTSWENVKLYLSTADPLLSAAAPKLNPFYADYQQLYNQNSFYSNGYMSPQLVQYDYASQARDKINVENSRVYEVFNSTNFDSNKLNYEGIIGSKRFNELKEIASVKMKQIQISELSTTFEIANLYSCPSDARPYLVEIKEFNLPATFTFISVPKMDQSAFVLANIVGWQDLDLVPGPTKVYFAGNYVGESEINTQNVSDTLALSFGRDPKIQVYRKLKSEMSSKKVSGSSKKETYFYDIEVRNNHNTPIKLMIYDQIPLSRNSDITVTTESIGNGKKDDITGEIVYELNLLSSQTGKAEFGYTVKYPKKESIQLKTFKTISSPSF